MLEHARHFRWLARVDLAHVSLALVGLMWVVPFLHFRHEYPLATFDQEWWSALLGVFALTLLTARDFWRQPEIPRIAQLPAALIAIVLLQLVLNKVAYFHQGLLYILYLLFAALLISLGARLRACFGMEKLAVVLAVFLLIGAELSALAGLQQYYRWHSPLESIVFPQTSSRISGNLAQPNQFADYVALGLISLGLLFSQHKLKMSPVVLLAAPLLFVLALSGSRSSWLYLMMMCALAWWWARRDANQRSLIGCSLAMLAGFALMHWVVEIPWLAGASASEDTFQRFQTLFRDNASGDIRLYLWHEAWLMFLQSPWLGVGFGQFAWHHIQLLPVLQQGNLTGLWNNAHNLIFQMAAEAGLAGLLVWLVSLGIWLTGLRRAALSPAHWWGHAVLGVLGIHSLLEYPLWYTFFVAVAAILLGALDETRYRLELRNVGRASVAAILVLGLVSLVQLRGSYQQLKDTLAIHPFEGNVSEDSQRIGAGLVAVHGGSLLSPYAELFLSSLAEVSDDHLKEKLMLSTRALHFIPTAPVTYRQAFLLAQNGQIEQARQILELAIWAYPKDAEARDQLVRLARNDPAHFSALLEFALQTDRAREHAVGR